MEWGTDPSDDGEDFSPVISGPDGKYYNWRDWTTKLEEYFEKLGLEVEENDYVEESPWDTPEALARFEGGYGTGEYLIDYSIYGKNWGEDTEINIKVETEYGENATVNFLVTAIIDGKKVFSEKTVKEQDFYNLINKSLQIIKKS